jgi:hypothetical protein
VALHRDMDGAEPLRPQPVEWLAGPEERRLDRGAWELAVATFGCPACDAPLLPDAEGMAPSDPVACGYCGQSGVVRDFLSLEQPARPARVVVRVVLSYLAP